MKIDLKNITIVVLIITVILLCVFRCEPTEKIVIATVPSVSGKFESKNPTHIDLPKNVKSNSVKSKNDKELFLEIEINKLLKEQEIQREEFASATDSLKKELFNKAIEPKEFKSRFDDDNVTIDINGIVIGEVKSVAPKYTIKEKKTDVIVRLRQRVFSLKTGVEYGNNLQLNNSTFKANIEFENKKGNSFSYGYDTNKTHWIGVKFTLFERKR